MVADDIKRVVGDVKNDEIEESGAVKREGEGALGWRVYQTISEVSRSERNPVQRDLRVCVRAGKGKKRVASPGMYWKVVNAEASGG